jgi:hypothetical protein
MTSAYVFPNNATLRQINQDYMPAMRAGRVGIDLFPEVDSDFDNVIWEQADDNVGLMQARGIGGSPPSVSPRGRKVWTKTPGYYGEFEPINELFITAKRQIGTWGSPIDVTDLVTKAQIKLMGRQYDRMEKVVWDLLAGGTYTVLGVSGVIQDSDAFPIPNYVAAVGWATFATATPLNDIRNVMLRARGHAVDFTGGKIYMNQVTFNNLAQNNNPADLYGRRAAGLSTINGLQGFNELLMGENLPPIVIYDRGWKDDTGLWQVFIPNGTAVAVGKRLDGSTIGEFLITRNANTEPVGSPGVYTHVIDTLDQGGRLPRTLEVHRGMNAGPALYYPSAVCRMTGL